MAKHRSYSVEFKRQVVQDYLAGETLYQGGFDPRTETTTILQVVKNPGWLIPYISCVMVSLGLIVHFGFCSSNAVSRLLGVSLLPSIPGLALDMVGAVTDFLLIEQAPLSEASLVLASQILEPRSGLRGEVFFLPDPKTLGTPRASRGRRREAGGDSR